MSKRFFSLISDRKFAKRLKVMQTLTDSLLSAEAKAVVAHSFCSGVMQEVSIVIKLNKEAILDREFLYEFVAFGWGKALGQYIDIKLIEGYGETDHKALRLAQLAVRSGTVLFAIYNVLREDYQKCYISIHHALADEHTLMVVSELIQVACAGEMDLALQNMRQGQKLYSSYVERQLMKAKDYSVLEVGYNYSMMALRLSEVGRLAWNTQVERISLQRVIQVGSIYEEKQLIEVVLEMLCSTADVVKEGNTVCSSRNWRLPQEARAVGMMTGLLAIPFGWKEHVSYNPQTSLEACARYSLVLREVLECCRASELFINGAIPRGIPASQVINSTFPVGIGMKRINSSEILLEIEGTFCNRAAATDLLNELADVLSDRRI
ncbi:hypothetical protein FE392_16520 [Xenorhabdus sp. 12]|uniref:Uncharacterized protein n=1 Tax=Xenorhabdus santafensis TaxID=2582833 RepID=A0ABU4SDQ4_9GAMM|nr:hypothetical protein [Xenorhabdus sp. 12]MDX7988909.1 hypothetical protein [Xenorhabdus sp. 12]